MAKGGGSARTVSANNASASRTSSSANNNSKGNAEYISTKTKEIEGFKLPGQNDFKYININVEKTIVLEITKQAMADMLLI